MIRRSLPDGDLLIAQHEHALHAGRLAARWGELAGPRRVLVRAVGLHDAGWPLLDDRPAPLPDGRPPHVFDHEAGFTVPAWRRSVAVARSVGALEALLVSRHFSGFSPDFAEEQADGQAAWRIGVAPAVEEEGARLLAWCDAVSLCLLCDPEETVRLPPGVTLESGVLSPWPFACNAFEDTVAGRLLPRRKWPDPGDFREAYESAPEVRIPVRLAPN